MTTYTPTEIKTTIKRLHPVHLKEARAGAISMTLGVVKAMAQTELQD